MNEIIIKRQNFEKAKNRLKNFSEKKEEDLKIQHVATDAGLLGWANHKVTGREFNIRMESLSKHLIHLNESNQRTNREFRAVYDALEALDKDYIARIVSNIKALEKTNGDIRKHQEILTNGASQLKNQQSTLDSQQLKTDRLVKQMEMSIYALKKFKEELDRLQHLTDIDHIWQEFQKGRKELKTHTRKLRSIQSTLTRTEGDIDQMNQLHNEHTRSFRELTEADEKTIHLISTHYDELKEVEATLTSAEQTIEDLLRQASVTAHQLETVTTNLEQLAHLKDVDYMWDALTSPDGELLDMSTILNEIEETFAQHENNLTQLQSFMNQVHRLTHLMDVDEMWEQTNNHKLRLNQMDQKHNEHTRSFRELTEADEKTIHLISTHYDELKEVEATLTSAEQTIQDLLKQASVTAHQLETVTTNLEQLAHLKDVDYMWDALTSPDGELLDMSTILNEIEETFAQHENDLTQLQSFMNQVHRLKHLMDVDEMWEQTNNHKLRLNRMDQKHNEHTRSFRELTEADEKTIHLISTHYDELKEVEATLTSAEQTIQDLLKQASVTAHQLETVTTNLEQLAHLKDVDYMWDALTSPDGELLDMSTILNEIEETFAQHENNLTQLQSFMNQVHRLKHLMDVDEMWEQTNNHKLRLNRMDQKHNEHTRSFRELTEADKKILDFVSAHSNTLDTHATQLTDSIHRDERLAEQLEKNQQETTEQFETLTKKIKHAYWIAGGSLSLAIIELIMLLAR